MLRAFFIFIFLIGCGSQQLSYGATYFVDGAIGCDTNDGLSKTQVSGSCPAGGSGPWKTINKGAATAVADDVVRVLPGTYTATNADLWTTFSTDTYGKNGVLTHASWNPAHSGTDGHPITFISDTPLAAIVTTALACQDMPAPINGNWNYYAVEQAAVWEVGRGGRSYIVIDGFTVHGRLVVWGQDNVGGVTQHNTFQNNDVDCGSFEGPDKSLLTLVMLNGYANNFNIIQNNYIHNPIIANNTPAGTSGSGSNIFLFFSSNNNLIQNNTVDCNFSHSVMKQGIGSKGGFTANNTIRNNKVSNCYVGINETGADALFQQATGSMHYQNIIYNDYPISSGSFAFALDHTTDNQIYYNNVVYNVGLGLGTQTSTSPQCNFNGQGTYTDNNIFYNNIVVGYSSGSSMGIWWGDQADPTHGCTVRDPMTTFLALSDYNDVKSGSVAGWAININYQGIGALTWTTIGTWQNSWPTLDTHSSNANPLFVYTSIGSPTNDFHLQGGSSLLNACHVGGVSSGTLVNCGAYPSSGQMDVVGYVPPGNVIITLGTASIQFLGNGSGTVTSNPTGINCTTGNQSGCNASFPTSSSVILTASILTGSTFGGWSGGLCSGTQLTCTVSMSSMVNVLAQFDAVVPVNPGNPVNPTARGANSRTPVTRTPVARTPR